MNGLTIDELTVQFDDTIAVDHVSLVVPEATVFALVGPSGCGKSTLLRSVAGLVRPTLGAVSWNAQSLADTPTHERDFGLMFQDHALFTHRSVAENIAFGLKMAGHDATAQAARVEELLALVGLDGFGSRRVDALSGGEGQRVALARALAPEPRLLLLDEPLASLDRARRVELNAELARLLRELGQTAIYVTHDQDEAFAVADQVGVMSDGRLLRIGTPAEVWRDPQSETVARFVGHDAIVERDGQRFAVRADAISIERAGSGDYTGVVEGSAFQGDRFEVTADVEGTSWRFFHDQPLAVGSNVSLSLDPGKLAAIH